MKNCHGTAIHVTTFNIFQIICDIQLQKLFGSKRLQEEMDRDFAGSKRLQEEMDCDFAASAGSSSIKVLSSCIGWGRCTELG